MKVYSNDYIPVNTVAAREANSVSSQTVKLIFCRKHQAHQMYSVANIRSHTCICKIRWSQIYKKAIQCRGPKYEEESISNQPKLFPIEIHLFFCNVIAL